MRFWFAASAGILIAVLLPVCWAEDSLADLTKNAAAHPDAAEPNVRLVERLLRDEQFDDAEAALKTALKANPRASELHRVEGDLLFREGHVFEAETAYRASYQIDTKNPLALYGIARIFRLSGLRGKAADLVRHAHQIAPENVEISSAFNALDRSGAGAAARWEKVLAEPEVAGDPAEKKYVETELAEARLLSGKHAFELVSPYQAYRMRYHILYDGKRATGIGVNISLNGVKSDLRLDTGAGGVNISSGFAARAGIRRIGDSKTGGVGNKGSVNSWIGYADRLQIGDVEFRNIIVTVKEKGSMDDSAGLLGTDIFERFLVKVNLYESRIDLDPLPGPVWDGYTPVNRYEGPELKDFEQFFQVGHYILLPTLVSEKQKSEQTSCLFLVDTGAETNNISTGLAPSVTKIRTNEYEKVSGVSGRVKMLYQADQVVLQFARFRQKNLDLTSFDLSWLGRSAGLEVSGILGLPVLALFQSFTIDYRDARIAFDYKLR